MKSSRTLAMSILLLAGLVSVPARAQTYDLSWYTMDGGGYSFSTSVSYELGGTIGQPDAGGPMNGTSYELLGGFWPGVRHTPPVPPANDNCVGATLVGTGSFPFDTTDATTDGPSEPIDCNVNGYTQNDNDVWFLYTAACTSYVTFDVCDASFNTRMVCYPSTSPAQCPPSPSVLGCSDDACGLGGLRSRLTLLVFSGEHYLVRVGGHQGASGVGTLVITPPGPLIYANPQSQIVPPGGNVEFEVNVSFVDTAQWRRNGANLSDGTTPHGSYISGSNSSFLFIGNVQPEDAGDYDMVVSDSCGSATSSAATLTVGSSPCSGDVNGDGNVDLNDYALFVDCVTGLDAEPINPGCVCFDADADGDVDLLDFAQFQIDFGG